MIATDFAKIFGAFLDVMMDVRLRLCQNSDLLNSLSINLGFGRYFYQHYLILLPGKGRMFTIFVRKESSEISMFLLNKTRGRYEGNNVHSITGDSRKTSAEINSSVTCGLQHEGPGQVCPDRESERSESIAASYGRLRSRISNRLSPVFCFAKKLTLPQPRKPFLHFYGFIPRDQHRSIEHQT